MINYILFRTGHLLSIALPLKFAYFIGISLSLIKYYFSPRDRHAVLGNLRKILPVSEHYRIRKYAKRVFVNFGKYLVEFFRFSYLSKDGLGKEITIKGLENIDNALKKNKGVIVLAAHIGNWELGGVFMGLLGYSISGVALPHRNPLVNAFFNSQRKRMGRGGMDVIPSSGMAIRRVYDALRKNRIVAVVGDRDFTATGKLLPFLGASKIIPRGPAVLALRTGATIVPGFVFRQEDNTQILEFFEALPEFKNEDEAIEACARVIEEKIRQYPDQWMMFREFWKE